MAVKGRSDELGPKGRVLSLFVSMNNFTKSEAKPKRSTANVWEKIAQESQLEMSKQMSKASLDGALRFAVPLYTNEPLKPADKVLVWRENVVNNRIGQWLSPHLVHNYTPDQKLFYVRWDNNLTAKPFRLADVKRYQEPEVTTFSFVPEVNKRLEYFREEEFESFPTGYISHFDSCAKGNEINQAT